MSVTKIEWTWTRVPIGGLTMLQLQEAFDIGAVLVDGEPFILVPGFTFNPWIGCTKVSPGCAKCYAAQQDAFRKWTPEGWGPGKPRRRTSVSNWNQVLKWDALAKRIGVRMRVFCASLADWLDDEVPSEWLGDLLALIQRTPNLDWLLLSKRPENWRSRLVAACPDFRDDMPLNAFTSRWLAGFDPLNVWAGTTVEDDQRANERIPQLLEIPARVRFLSCEPLLERINLVYATFNGSDSITGMEGIHWVIVGGESGPEARPFNVEAAWDIVLTCRESKVPVFVKQLGANPVTTNANAMEWPDETVFIEAGSAAASARVKLRDRKGGDTAEWPEELKVRQYPEVSA